MYRSMFLAVTLVSYSFLANAAVIKNVRGLQFDAYFPKSVNGSSPHAKIVSEFPNMTNATICFWMYPQKTYFIPVSYSSPKHDHEFQVSVDSFSTYITLGQNTKMKVNSVPPKHQWTNLCFVWKGETGRSKLYFNGKLLVEPFVMRKGYTMQGNGHLIVGQDLNSQGLPKSSISGMIGRVSELHIWDEALPKSSIAKIARCSPLYFGNVVDWRESFIRLDDYATPKKTTLPCVQHLTVDYPCQNVDYEEYDDTTATMKSNTNALPSISPVY